MRAATLPVTPTSTWNFSCATDELFPAAMPGSGREMGSMLQYSCAGTGKQRHCTNRASQHSSNPNTFPRGSELDSAGPRASQNHGMTLGHPPGVTHPTKISSTSRTLRAAQCLITFFSQILGNRLLKLEQRGHKSILVKFMPSKIKTPTC